MNRQEKRKLLIEYAQSLNMCTHCFSRESSEGLKWCLPCRKLMARAVKNFRINHPENCSRCRLKKNNDKYKTCDRCRKA